MQNIFAQAYQKSLGKTDANAAKGQKALEELYDAMKKGNVYSAKLLPFVAEIAKEMAAPGLEKARQSAKAEQARFENQISEGWAKFGEGGGNEGLAFFWRMMQTMGKWWVDNGEMLGGMFEKFVLWLDVLRLGVYEFYQFAVDGTDNDLVKIFRDWGIDLLAMRESVAGIIDQVAVMFKGDGTTSLMSALVIKIQNFARALQDVMVQIADMMEGVQLFVSGYQKWSAAPLWQKLTLTAFEGQGMMIQGATKTAWNAGQAAYVGAGALTDLATKTTLDPRINIPTEKSGVIPKRESTWNPWNAEQTASQLGPTRAAAAAQQNVQVDVNLKVDGNAESIKLLIDEKTKQSVSESVGTGIQNALQKQFQGAQLFAPMATQ